MGAGPSSGSSYFWSGSGSAVHLFDLVVAAQSFHVLGMAGAAAVAAFTRYHAGLSLRCRPLAVHLQSRPRPCPCLRLVLQKSGLGLREVDRQLVAVPNCMLHRPVFSKRPCTLEMVAAVGLFVRHGLVIRVGFRRRVQRGPGVLDELVSAIWRTKSRARWLAGSQELAKILRKKSGSVVHKRCCWHLWILGFVESHAI